MKGILVEKHGSTDVMQFKEIKVAKPGPGQARVKIMAAGLNFIDIYQRRGEYPVNLPYTPGLEAAGIVEEVGQDVTNVKVGDRVAYTSQPGAYAEESLTKADMLIPIPEALSWEQAASFPLQGMTAHYLIHEFHKIEKGDTVLIHAAAGGMGLLLVQWAKHLGARVFGTVSNEEKAKAAKDAGADEIIFYNKENFVDATNKLTNNEGVKFIIDGVGKTTFAGNLEAAARRGKVVIYGLASGPAEPILPNGLMTKSVTVCGGSLANYLLNREELLYRSQDVLKGIQEGWLKLRIDHVLPLDKAVEAHELLESRRSIGKIVLKTGN